MKRTTILLAASAMFLATGCKDNAPSEPLAPTPAQPEPTKPAAPGPAVDADLPMPTWA